MYRGREHASRCLAAALSQYAGPDTVVVGLPDGGQAVAEVVAAVLHAKLSQAALDGDDAATVAAFQPGGVLHQKTVILVDDGLAPRTTLEAAIARARSAHPRRIVVAVPDQGARLYLAATG